MKIEVLFFAGCPNHPPTVSLVRSVADELGITAPVLEVEVQALSDAKRLTFLGSPTVLVEGQDIERDRQHEQTYGLSCRRYGDSGVPSRDLIASALGGRT